MRLPDKPRISWVDSICIDQNNTDERGHQVGTTCRIYGTTSQNLVWLGPYDDIIAESINAMEVMLQEVAIESRDDADFGKFSFENDRFPRFSKDRVSNTVGCLALVGLLDNPWFTRLWIVQDASLASSSMCHYSEFKVSLNVLRLEDYLTLQMILGLSSRRARIDKTTSSSLACYSTQSRS